MHFSSCSLEQGTCNVRSVSLGKKILVEQSQPSPSICVAEGAFGLSLQSWLVATETV